MKEREKKEGSKNHCSDGLPAEGYDGAGQGHITRWLTPGFPQREGENILV